MNTTHTNSSKVSTVALKSILHSLRVQRFFATHAHYSTRIPSQQITVITPRQTNLNVFWIQAWASNWVTKATRGSCVCMVVRVWANGRQIKLTTKAKSKADGAVQCWLECIHWAKTSRVVCILLESNGVSCRCRCHCPCPCLCWLRTPALVGHPSVTATTTITTATAAAPAVAETTSWANK